MLSTITLTSDSAHYAITKLRSFVKVNKVRTPEEKEEALALFCEALGIEEPVLSTLQFMLIEAFPDDASHVFIGTLVGLAMTEYALENSE